MALNRLLHIKYWWSHLIVFCPKIISRLMRVGANLLCYLALLKVTLLRSERGNVDEKLEIYNICSVVILQDFTDWDTFLCLSFFKVQLLWEGPKILKTLLSNVKKIGVVFFSNFVAFLEYLTFEFFFIMIKETKFSFQKFQLFSLLGVLTLPHLWLTSA